MEKKRERIREQWKKWWIGSMLFMLLSMFIQDRYNGFPSHRLVFVSIGFSLFMFFVVYFFAYQKKGTKMLTFSIISSTLGMISGCRYIGEVYSAGLYGSFFWLTVPAQYLFGIWMLVLHWRLRKVNQEMRKAVPAPLPTDGEAPSK